MEHGQARDNDHIAFGYSFTQIEDEPERHTETPVASALLWVLEQTVEWAIVGGDSGADLAALAGLGIGVERGEDERIMTKLVIAITWWASLWFAFPLMAILRLAHVITWSWWLVCLPALGYGFVTYLCVALRHLLRLLSKIEEG